MIVGSFMLRFSVVFHFSEVKSFSAIFGGRADLERRGRKPFSALLDKRQKGSILPRRTRDSENCGKWSFRFSFLTGNGITVEMKCRGNCCAQTWPRRNILCF